MRGCHGFAALKNLFYVIGCFSDTQVSKQQTTKSSNHVHTFHSCRFIPILCFGVSTWMALCWGSGTLSWIPSRRRGSGRFFLRKAFNKQKFCSFFSLTYYLSHILRWWIWIHVKSLFPLCFFQVPLKTAGGRRGKDERQDQNKRIKRGCTVLLVGKQDEESLPNLPIKQPPPPTHAPTLEQKQR